VIGPLLIMLKRYVNLPFSFLGFFFGGKQKLIRRQVGVQTDVEYVDHTKYAVNRWQALGPTAAATYYPNDSTHTDPAGALSKFSSLRL